MQCEKLRFSQGLRGLNSGIGPLERMEVMLLMLLSFSKRLCVNMFV